MKLQKFLTHFISHPFGEYPAKLSGSYFCQVPLYLEETYRFVKLKQMCEIKIKFHVIYHNKLIR